MITFFKMYVFRKTICIIVYINTALIRGAI